MRIHVYNDDTSYRFTAAYAIAVAPPARGLVSPVLVSFEVGGWHARHKLLRHALVDLGNSGDIWWSADAEKVKTKSGGFVYAEGLHLGHFVTLLSSRGFVGL